MSRDARFDSPSQCAVRWRCIASSDDLRLVSSKRVRFTSMDVNQAHVVLGANTGSAYVFARTKMNANANARANELRESQGDGDERAARFVTTVTPEVLECAQSSARAAPQSVSAIRVSGCGRLCAMGFVDGSVRVIDMDGLSSGDSTRRRSTFGATVGYLLSTHAGRRITALRWGDRRGELFAGSDRGMVTVMSFMDFIAWCDGGRKGERPPTSNKAEFVDVASPMHQIDVSPSNVHAILSAEATAEVLVVSRAVKEDIGSKQREGAYGSCFHRYSARSLGDDGDGDDDQWVGGKDKPSESLVEHAVLARPGRKLWIAKFKSDKTTTLNEVVATLKLDVPPPSATPGWMQPEEGLTADELKRMTKKFEFGLLHNLGPCLLSTSERAVAIVDVASPAISRWYPFKEPGSMDLSAGFIDVCVSDHRAFFLTPSGDMGNSVWCLESFANAKQLIEDAACDKTSVTSVVRALDLCRKLDYYDHDLFQLGRELFETSTAKDADIQDSLDILLRWGVEVGVKLPPMNHGQTDLREDSTAEEAVAPIPSHFSNQRAQSEKSSSSNGKPRAVAVAEPAQAKEIISEALGEYPKAESDGIFFYNPKGVAKTSKDAPSVDKGSIESNSSNSKPMKRVQKIRAQIIEEDEDEDAAMDDEVSTPKAGAHDKYNLDSKDFKTDIPSNDQEWAECDKFDDKQWRRAIQAAEATLVDEGERFEHWSAYDVSNHPKKKIAFSGTNLRLDYRTAMHSRVDIVAKCLEELSACRVSLDASPVIPLLRQWRDVCGEMLRLRAIEDSNLAMYPSETLLVDVEKSLQRTSEELNLDSPALTKKKPEQRQPVNGVQGVPMISTDVEKLQNDLLAYYGSDNENQHSVETELVASLRALAVDDATLVIVNCSRRALLDLVSSFAEDEPAINQCSSRIERLTQIGSTVLGPAVVIKCITDAAEDDVLANLIVPQRSTEPVASAISKILTAATVWLTSEHAIDLRLRRNAAKLLEPLDDHLYRPPPRAYGRFPQLRAVLEAEIVSLNNVETVAFIRRTTDEEKRYNNENSAVLWTLKSPHTIPIAPSIEDRGDWGVKMDLDGCPACRRSVLMSGSSDIVTFPCSHTFHASCVSDGTCAACLGLAAHNVFM